MSQKQPLTTNSINLSLATLESASAQSQQSRDKQTLRNHTTSSVDSPFPLATSSDSRRRTSVACRRLLRVWGQSWTGCMVVLAAPLGPGEWAPRPPLACWLAGWSLAWLAGAGAGCVGGTSVGRSSVGRECGSQLEWAGRPVRSSERASPSGRGAWACASRPRPPTTPGGAHSAPIPDPQPETHTHTGCSQPTKHQLWYNLDNRGQSQKPVASQSHKAASEQASQSVGG